MGKSILWYQHEDSSIGDVIFCNGERVLDKNEEILNFDTIKSKADKVIKKHLPWCGNVSGYFFMKGFLQSKDDKQRRMCFMYVTDLKDYESACREELKAAGLTMSEDSEQCLKKKQLPSWLILTGLVLIVLAIIGIVTYLNNSNHPLADLPQEISSIE